MHVSAWACCYRYCLPRPGGPGVPAASASLSAAPASGPCRRASLPSSLRLPPQPPFLPKAQPP